MRALLIAAVFFLCLSIGLAYPDEACSKTKGEGCTAFGSAPDCCSIGLVCKLDGSESGTCCIPPNSTISCDADSDCCFGKCISGACTISYSCGMPCSISAECSPSCPICADEGGSKICRSCISPGSPTLCKSSADCCAGAYCSPSDRLCVSCFGEGKSCSTDEECCSGRCEQDSQGSKHCLAEWPACSMEGGICETDESCCGSPPSSAPLMCDLLNPPPNAPPSFGACRRSYPIGAACNQETHIQCPPGYDCIETSPDFFRCIGNPHKLPVGWLVVGDGFFEVKDEAKHSGEYGLSIQSSGSADSYIYTNELVLKNSTNYFLELWAYRDGEPLRYSIYDINNDAYLSESGDWIASPRDGDFEAPIILNISTPLGRYDYFGRSFFTLSKNVSHVQLRFYPPIDGSEAFVDDISITEINDFTIIAWIRPSIQQGDGRRIFYQFGKESKGEYGEVDQGIDWNMDASNWLNMGLYSSLGDSLIPRVNLSDGGLHMVALSVKRTENYTAYLDGVSVESAPFSLGRLNASSSFYIGSDRGVAGFNGTIDEIRFYKRALSSEEIISHYRGYYQPFCKLDISASYSGIAGLGSKSLNASYNAHLRLRKLPSSTILSMPFDTNISLDYPGAIQDYSPSSLSGTKTDAYWAPFGVIGGAFLFNSSQSKIQLPTPLVSGTGDFTLSAWVYLASDASHANYVMGNFGTSNPGGVKLFVSASRLGISIGSSNITSSSTIAPNRWYHIAATRQNGVATLYINGLPEGNGTLSGSIGNAANFTIGNGPDYTTDHFSGLIDEVRAFSRALTESEIQALYRDSWLTYSSLLPALGIPQCPAGVPQLCKPN